MIRFDNVTKRFGDKTVLDELNIEIPKGKITFIVGKSGEGKSVTIKHIMGLLKANFRRRICRWRRNVKSSAKSKFFNIEKTLECYSNMLLYSIHLALKTM